MKQLRILLLVSVITLFTTYANASVNMAPIISYLLSDSTATLSGLDTIKAYANDQSNPVPTVQDYEDAGVVGVTLENIDDINGVIASLTSIDVDTKEEVQTIVDDVNSNTPPIANAGIDQHIEAGFEGTILDGSLSEDADNDPLMFSWSFVDGPYEYTGMANTDTVNPLFGSLDAGEFDIQLIVNDGIVDSAPDIVTVTVTMPINTVPVANAGPDQNVETGSLVTLDGSGSSDADVGDTLTYLWSFTSYPGATEPVLSDATDVNPTFTADVAGSYVIQLIVNDDIVNSDPDTVSVTATTEFIWHFSLPYGTVISPYTSRKWLDRNLGATQVCTARNDGLCYGNYFQWGRSYNGHNLIGLPTSPILVTSLFDDAVYDPTNPFRVISSSPADWLAAGIDDSGSTRATAWGNATDNSVCPTGYRVPTMNELNAETIDVGKNTLIKVFEDFLKLPAAGWRNPSTGAYEAGGEFGSMFIWSNSILLPSNAFYLNISISGYIPNPDALRAYGFSIRCIQDY